MENGRRCHICNNDVHRAPYAKNVGSKKHLENVSQDDIIVPEWLLKEEQEPIMKKFFKKVDNPKTLKQTARDNINIDDKELNKESAKKMIIPCYFTDEILILGVKINLESHNINHANSILSFIAIYTDFRIEERYNNKILKDMAPIYARLINQ